MESGFVAKDDLVPFRCSPVSSCAAPLVTEAWMGGRQEQHTSCHNLTKQINLEVDSDGVQKLLDFHNQELTIDELIEMDEQKQDIEDLESLDKFNEKIG
ncbi:hypothetical protein TNCV_134131 [Trichonephila clavipes]|nr:hypothetical protein TNCV_134131 [Trichonephila clavipes]